MKRWRDSITTTIALTVVVAMLLGFSLQRLVSSGLLYIGLAPQQTLQIGNSQPFQQLPGRIAALLDVLDGTPGAERPVVIAAAQRPSIRIRLLDAPMPNLVNRGEPDADLLRRRIEAVLTVPRPVVVVNAYGPANQQAGAVDGRVQNGMFVEAALSDGHWLFFTTPLIPPPAVDPVATKFSRASFTAWLALSIALGILLSMLAARRLIICQDASDVGEPVTFSVPAASRSASSSLSKTMVLVFRGASARRSLIHSTGLKALATPTRAVSGSVSQSPVQLYGSMVETSALPLARAEV